jgi:hypothetical protein
MDLYQENIPNLILSTNYYTQKKQKLFDYVMTNRKRITDSTTNLISLLTTDEGFNICGSLVYVGEIIERYDLCTDKMKAIVSKIDKDYK